MPSVYIDDDPLAFFEFGMDRFLPSWVQIDHSSQVLHLGPGKKMVPGAIECEYPEFDFDRPDCLARFADGSVGGIVATHVLEHLADPRTLLRECGRVLRTGRPLNVLVPHGLSPLYAQDLDHKTPFVIDTFKTLLDTDYYDKEKAGFPFALGPVFSMAVKDGNEAVIAQLVRRGNNG